MDAIGGAGVAHIPFLVEASVVNSCRREPVKNWRFAENPNMLTPIEAGLRSLLRSRRALFDIDK